MPCYEPPMTRREIREYHENGAIRILRKLDISFKNGPDAVQKLCDLCKDADPKVIERVGAKWWYQDHRKYDLRREALAKLTNAEKAALRVRDEDKE